MGILFVKANFCFAENFKLSFPQQVVSLSPALLSTISSRKHFRAIVRMRRPSCQDCQVIRGGVLGLTWQGSSHFRLAVVGIKRMQELNGFTPPQVRFIVTAIAICSFYFLDCSWLQFTISSLRAGRKGTGASAWGCLLSGILKNFLIF